MNALSLTVRVILFIYMPFILMLQVVYQAIFGSAMQINWPALVLYLGVFMSWIYSRYKYGIQFEDNKHKSDLKRLLTTER